MIMKIEKNGEKYSLTDLSFSDTEVITAALYLLYLQMPDSDIAKEYAQRFQAKGYELYMETERARWDGIL